MNKQYRYYAATYCYNAIRDNYDLDNFEAFDNFNAALILFRHWVCTKAKATATYDKVVLGRVPYLVDEEGNAHPLGKVEKLYTEYLN